MNIASKQINGKWRFTRYALDGVEYLSAKTKDSDLKDALLKVVIQIEDGKFHFVRDGETQSEIRFSADTSKNPHWIDFESERGKQLGIYKVSKNSIQFAISTPKNKRPLTFLKESNKELGLITLTRIK